MALEVHLVGQPAGVPSLVWRHDPATGILSGSIRTAVTTSGYTGSVELADDEGSAVIVDIAGGVVAGLDIVVWPEAIVLPGLAAPAEARVAQVMIPSRTARRGVAALEVDTTLSLSADTPGATLHLRIGTRRPVETVRIADTFLADVDAAGRLAGFWLERVPGRAA